jgi:hypothetical protein
MGALAQTPENTTDIQNGPAHHTGQHWQGSLLHKMNVIL